MLTVNHQHITYNYPIYPPQPVTSDERSNYNLEYENENNNPASFDHYCERTSLPNNTYERAITTPVVNNSQDNGYNNTVWSRNCDFDNSIKCLTLNQKTAFYHHHQHQHQHLHHYSALSPHSINNEPEFINYSQIKRKIPSTTIASNATATISCSTSKYSESAAPHVSTVNCENYCLLTKSPQTPHYEQAQHPVIFSNECNSYNELINNRQNLVPPINAGKEEFHSTGELNNSVHNIEQYNHHLYHHLHHYHEETTCDSTLSPMVNIEQYRRQTDECELIHLPESQSALVSNHLSSYQDNEQSNDNISQFAYHYHHTQLQQYP